MLVLASCEKDPFDEFLKQDSYGPKPGMIWDMSPIEFVLEVTDAQGHNMFDKATPNNWLSEPFSATFDGASFQWPDGSKDKIRVQHAMRWTRDGNPEYYTAFKVNGVPVDGYLIHLTK